MSLDLIAFTHQIMLSITTKVNSFPFGVFGNRHHQINPQFLMVVVEGHFIDNIHLAI